MHDKLKKLISEAGEKELSIPYISEDGAEALADYLIENDVVEVVRCKDCEYWESSYGFCKRVGVDCFGNSSFYKNSFCSCGKRRED